MKKKNPDKKPVRRVHSSKGGASIVPGNPGNSGGKKGRSGRKSMVLIAALVAIGDDPRAQEALEKAARNPNSRGFGTAWSILTRYRPEFRQVSTRRMLEGDVPATVPETPEEIPGDAEVARALLVLQKAEREAGRMKRAPERPS